MKRGKKYQEALKANKHNTHLIIHDKERNLQSQLYLKRQNEVTLENMTVTKDMKHVILKGENEQYLVKLEDEISHIVTESMSKFFE